jgi:hypothetical protein
MAKTFSTPLPRNLKESVEQLSVMRSEIIRPILEHPREYALLRGTCSEIICGFSIGFEATAELLLENVRSKRAPATSAKAMQAYPLAKDIPVWRGGKLKSGVGRKNNLARSSLPGFTLPRGVTDSKRDWDEAIIDPSVQVTSQGTIRVPTTPGFGYHVRHDLIERLSMEKETWRAR